MQGSEFQFQANWIGWGFDRTNRQHPISDFSIQRRADTPYTDKKYFSQAPVSTEEHLKLLEEFESELLTQ